MLLVTNILFDKKEVDFLPGRENQVGYVEDLRTIIGHRPVILVGANVIIIDKLGRVLLQQRTEPYGVWGLPGGLMELGESAEETARREVFEETSLSLGKLELLDVFSGKHLFMKVQNGDEFYCVTIVYTTTEASGEAKVNDDESLDIKYFHLDDLPKRIPKSHRLMLDRFMKKS